MKKERDNRSHRITFRLNDEEVKFLDDFSKSVGISRSDIIRNLIKKIQGDVSIIKTDRLLNELAAMSAEQGRVNNNINQLAKHANEYSNTMGINPKVFSQFNVLLSSYLDHQEEMNKTLKGIYKSIS
jgi:ABC-type transporter Mla subunit MlaD